MADDPGLREIGGRTYLAGLAAAAPAAISGLDIAHRTRAAVADWRALAKPRVIEAFLRDKALTRGVLSDAAALAGHFEAQSDLGEICAASLAGQDIPSRDELVEGMIPRDAVTILAGDGGTGKSLLALQLAVAIQLQTNWIGRVV
ncbi:MAG: AAA family ATPase, partial [Alphaproteobacteria bacterium]|nr:AAA family ATPase [Alphaproteobacteria bacterium]